MAQRPVRELSGTTTHGAASFPFELQLLHDAEAPSQAVWLAICTALKHRTHNSQLQDDMEGLRLASAFRLIHTIMIMMHERCHLHIIVVAPQPRHSLV